MCCSLETFGLSGMQILSPKVLERKSPEVAVVDLASKAARRRETHNSKYQNEAV